MTSVAFRTSENSGKVVRADQYYSPLLQDPAYNVPKQPITISFDNTRCMAIIDNKGENNPLDINSYAAEQIGDRNYRFRYTFTETDYNRAQKCP